MSSESHSDDAHRCASLVGGRPAASSAKMWLLRTSHRVCICLGKRLITPQHAPPHSSILEPFSVYRPGGPAACHACRPDTGDAYYISRAYTLLSNCVVQCMRVLSLPALLLLSEPVGRSVGRSAARGRRAGAHFGKATRPHPLKHPSRRIFLGSRRNSARCARTARLTLGGTRRRSKSNRVESKCKWNGTRQRS